MLSYDKWKMLNESLGSTVLGLGRKQSLGLVSNIPGIAEPQISERDHCPTGECGEADQMDDEGDDLESDAAVDLEDYSDEYDDTEAVEEEEDTEEDDVEDDDYEEEEEYDDETEGEDEEFDDEEEDEEEVEDEEDDDTDGNKEYEDEDVEFEDEDSDGDTETGELGMDTQSNESKKNKNGMISESDWWASVTSQIGQMSPSGDISINELEVKDIIKAGVGSNDGGMADTKRQQLTMASKLRIPSNLKRALRGFIMGEMGGTASRNPKQLMNLLNFLAVLIMDPTVKQTNRVLAKQNAVRSLRDTLNALEAKLKDKSPEVEEIEVEEEN